VWAFELTQRAAEIQGRLEGVKDVKFVAGPLPEAQVEDTPATPQAPPPAPTPEQSEQAAEWAAEIAEEELRKIVTKTVEMSLAQLPNDRSF
jgi:hypothetical protein